MPRALRLLCRIPFALHQNPLHGGCARALHQRAESQSLRKSVETTDGRFNGNWQFCRYQDVKLFVFCLEQKLKRFPEPAV